MKKSLLATVAAVTLIASLGIASAQKQDGPAQKSEQPARAPAAVQNAPAEKVAPAGKVAPDMAAETKPNSGDMKAQSDDQRRGQSTTGQAAPGGQSTQQKASEPSKSPSQAAQPTQSQPSAQQQRSTPQGAQQAPAQQSGSSATAPRQGSSTTAQGSASPSGASVSFTAEQKTKIRSTVLTGSAPRVTNVNFSISVGTVVPRTVRVVAVPPTLVEIQPAWRGYMYFVHGDEIIIVEPGSLRIVAVISV